MLSPATYNAVRCLSAMEAAAIECPPDAELGLNMERVSGMISNCNISPGFWRARQALRDAAADNGHAVPKPRIWDLMTELGAPEAARLCQIAKGKLGARPDSRRRRAGWGAK